MRHRSKRDIGEYDSLTDTVTNVVGVLIIVLAVTRVSLGSMPGGDTGGEVSPEALEEASERHSDMVRLLNELRERWGVLESDVPAQRIERDRLEEAIRGLEEELAHPMEAQTSLERLAQELEDLRAAIAALERQEHDAHRELRELLARLDTRDYGVPPQRQLTVPFADPEKAKGKENFKFYCQSGRVHPLAFDVLVDRLNEQAGVIPGFRGRTQYERHKLLARHLAETDVGDEFLRWSVELTEFGDRYAARAELERRTEIGETLEELDRAGSTLLAALGKLDPDEHWICFIVWDDSFEAYLEADRIAKSQGFATGWIAYAAGEVYGVSLTGSGGSGGLPLAPQ